MHWYTEPTTWIIAASVLTNAAITRFQVTFLWARDRDRSEEIALLKGEVASLREWRAQAREQIKSLKHDGSEDE